MSTSLPPVRRIVTGIDANGRSSQEVQALWTYIADRLEKNFRRTVFTAPGVQQTGFPVPRPAMGGFGRRVVS